MRAVLALHKCFCNCIKHAKNNFSYNYAIPNNYAMPSNYAMPKCFPVIMQCQMMWYLIMQCQNDKYVSYKKNTVSLHYFYTFPYIQHSGSQLARFWGLYPKKCYFIKEFLSKIAKNPIFNPIFSGAIDPSPPYTQKSLNTTLSTFLMHKNRNFIVFTLIPERYFTFWRENLPRILR